MDLVIREVVTESDFYIIQKLDYEAREEDMKNGYMILNVEEIEANFFSKKPKGFFLLLQDDVPCGYACVTNKSQYTRIAHKYTLGPFFIRPAFRGKGLGMIFLQLLFKHVALCSGQEYINIVLIVSEKNLPAKKLYQKAGFVVFGREKLHSIFNSQPQSALYMQKILIRPR